MNSIQRCLILSAIILNLSCNSAEIDRPVTKDTLTAPVTNTYASYDQSPMDMSYFPSGYPLKELKGDSTPPLARVIYSRPHKKNRIIFGNDEKSLVPYGKPWRLGANEATEIEFFTNVDFNGRQIKKGRYIIYCIPLENEWTLALNNNLNSWGLNIDSTQDVMRTTVSVQKLEPPLEDFTMVFLPADHGTDLLMAWDTVKVLVPVKFYR